MMNSLRAQLTFELSNIEGVEDRPAPLSGGSALFYRGVPFAHFHNDNELDLRLTKKHIKALGLLPPTDSFYHPNRSPNSAWIEVRFNTPADIEKLLQLVKLAVTALGNTSTKPASTGIRGVAKD